MSDVLVLCYHAVSPAWPAALSVTPDAFRRQLAMLRRAGYEGATFTRAVSDPPAARTVVVTFDDAYRSVFTLALPELRAIGWPATLFVPTDHVGTERPMCWPGIEQWMGGPHEEELIPMGWDEVGGLVSEGWEIGSHTRSHPRLTTLSDAPLADELRLSREEVERRLGRPCPAIAYPYGDVDERVVAATRATGYTAGAALPPGGWHAPRPLEFPRVGVWHDEPTWRVMLKAARVVRSLRARRSGSGVAA